MLTKILPEIQKQFSYVKNYYLNIFLQKNLFKFSSNKYKFAKDIPSNVERKKMNLFESVNNALDIVLSKDKTYFKY